MIVINSGAVHSNWREVVNSVSSGEFVLVERYRKPILAIIPYEDFVALSEELENRFDLRQATIALDEFKRDPSRGRTIQELIAEVDALDAAQNDDQLDNE